MNRTLVFDACALIAFLNDEEGADIVEGYLEEAKQKTLGLIMNKINLPEIYYGVYRDDGLEAAASTIETIKKTSRSRLSRLSRTLYSWKPAGSKRNTGFPWRTPSRPRKRTS